MAIINSSLYLNGRVKKKKSFLKIIMTLIILSSIGLAGLKMKVSITESDSCVQSKFDCTVVRSR